MRSRFLPMAGGGILALVVLGTTIVQVMTSRHNLATETLKRGRIVIVSGTPREVPAPIQGDGSPSRLLDENLEEPTLLENPTKHPEGLFFLSDLALTHYPPEKKGMKPRERQPLALIIYNGVCTACPPEVFRSYPRIKKARLEILHRRANDPDVEMVIPDARIVYLTEIELPDRPGPVEIPLPMPVAEKSESYPEHVFYIIAKIMPKELYPGTKAQTPVGLAEIEYVDRSPGGPRHVWK